MLTWFSYGSPTRVNLSVNSILVYYDYRINLHFLWKYNLYIIRAITHCSHHFRNLQKCVFQHVHIPGLCWKGLGNTDLIPSKFCIVQTCLPVCLSACLPVCLSACRPARIVYLPLTWQSCSDQDHPYFSPRQPWNTFERPSTRKLVI